MTPCLQRTPYPPTPRLLTAAAAAFPPPPGAPAHQPPPGEEDAGLKRGRPLRLAAGVYGALSDLWAGAGFDYDYYMIRWPGRRSGRRAWSGSGGSSAGACAAFGTAPTEAVGSAAGGQAGPSSHPCVSLTPPPPTATHAQRTRTAGLHGFKCSHAWHPHICGEAADGPPWPLIVISRLVCNAPCETKLVPLQVNAPAGRMGSSCDLRWAAPRTATPASWRRPGSADPDPVSVVVS
jgi:hypothetical protein